MSNPSPKKEDVLTLLDGLTSYLSELQNDDDLLAQIEQVVPREELANLMAGMLTTMFKGATMSKKSSARQQEMFAKEIGKTVSALTDYTLRVLSKEELAERIPAALTKQSSIDLLRAESMNGLADVCAVAAAKAANPSAVKKPGTPEL